MPGLGMRSRFGCPKTTSCHGLLGDPLNLSLICAWTPEARPENLRLMGRIGNSGLLVVCDWPWKIPLRRRTGGVGSLTHFIDYTTTQLHNWTESTAPFLS